MSEFWTGPESILRGYLARQELNQRDQELALQNQSLLQQHQQARDLLDFHYKQLDQAEKAHKEQMTMAKILLKNQMGQYYNLIHGTPDDALMPSSNISGFTPQSTISDEPNITGGASAQFGPRGEHDIIKPGEIGAITPNLQHTLQTQATQPWQYTPPEFEGTDLGSLTIDPNYRKQLEDIGLNQEKVKALGKQLAEEATLPANIAKIRAMFQGREQIVGEQQAGANQRALANINARAAQGSANRANNWGLGQMRLFGTVFSALTRGQGNQLDAPQYIGSADQILSGVRKPGANKYDEAASNAIAKLGWKPMDPKDNALLDDVVTMNGLYDSQLDYARTLASGPEGKAGDILGSNPIFGSLINHDQKFYKDIMDQNNLNTTRIQNGFSQRLNIPELSAQKKGQPLMTDFSPDGIKKVLLNRTRFYQGMWDKLVSGMPTEEKVYQYERKFGGLSGMESVFGDKAILNPKFDKSKPVSDKNPRIIPYMRSDAKGTYLYDFDRKSYIKLDSIPSNLRDILPQGFQGGASNPLMQNIQNLAPLMKAFGLGNMFGGGSDQDQDEE